MSNSKDLDKRRVNRQSTSKKDPKKFAKLKAMQCYPDVLEMLRAGYNYGQIAEFIHVQADEYTDIKRRSLEKILSDFYRDEIPDIEKVVKAKPEAVSDAIDNITHQVDVLNELGKLYHLQMERIQLNYTREKQVGMVFKTTGREVKIASEILQQIGEFQQDYGMKPRQLGILGLEAKATVNVEEKLKLPSGFISNPRKRERMIQFIRRVESMDPRVLEAAAINVDDVIDVTPEDDSEEDSDD